MEFKNIQERIEHKSKKKETYPLFSLKKQNN